VANSGSWTRTAVHTRRVKLPAALRPKWCSTPVAELDWVFLKRVNGLPVTRSAPCEPSDSSLSACARLHFDVEQDLDRDGARAARGVLPSLLPTGEAEDRHQAGWQAAGARKKARSSRDPVGSRTTPQRGTRLLDECTSRRGAGNTKAESRSCSRCALATKLDFRSPTRLLRFINPEQPSPTRTARSLPWTSRSTARHLESDLTGLPAPRCCLRVPAPLVCRVALARAEPGGVAVARRSCCQQTS